MTVLITIETVVLALMALLVAGLLRSHAEILRRLEALAPTVPHAVAQAATPATVGHDLPPARRTVTPAFDIAGTSLDGDAMKLAMTTGRPGGTLLVFLSTGCLSCRAFWDGLRAGESAALPGSPRVLVVTKDSSHESPSKLRDLAPVDIPLVMSSTAWESYAIAGSPYFVHVGPGGDVLGEGTAGTWGQVASLLRDAIDDAAVAGRRGPGSASASGPMRPADRLRRADEELASAGIGPDHPSLYGPGGPASAPAGAANGEGFDERV